MIIITPKEIWELKLRKQNYGKQKMPKGLLPVNNNDQPISINHIIKTSSH